MNTIVWLLGVGTVVAVMAGVGNLVRLTGAAARHNR